MTAPQDDPRWQRLMDPDYTCPCCGRSFGGLFDITYDHPAPWPHGSRIDQGNRALVVGDDRLGSDLCILDNQRFIRGVLRLPVIDTAEVFAYGVWGSVTEECFNHYTTDYDGKADIPFEGCFAWLCNLLPGWEMTEALPCDLHASPLGQRPTLWVHPDSNHPLATAQETGITFDHLLDLYAEAGQDIRPHLKFN